MSGIDIPGAKIESESDRPTRRPQRPPPPPPTQSEPSSFVDVIAIPSDHEYTPPPTETFNEFNNDVKDDYPTLLSQFNELFENFDFESIRKKILTRQMTTSPFTSVLWRIFLHCLPRDSSQWEQTINTEREKYDEYADKYLLDLKKIREYNGDSKDLNHPLSQEDNSLWNQYYIHLELKDNIDQDVRRTCQEIPFFQQKHILDLLLKVLYIHSRVHGQTIPYRQGMHEILAVIVYVICNESEKINEYPESNDLMKKLYDPNYLAHDSFGIYEKIMEHLQQYYDFKPIKTTSHKVQKKDKLKTTISRSSIIPVQTNDTVMRVDAIFEHLRDHDQQLYEKLQDLSIEPAVYGIRWLRLLFGREIPFDSIPTLWTIIFCHDEFFGFVDYFFLALLIKIGQLFDKHGVSEYSFCLQYLMQPNVLSDVESIIQKALSLERVSRQHLTSSCDVQFSRVMSKDFSKPTSPFLIYTHNPLIDSMRSNSSTSISSSSKFAPTDPSKEKEMMDSPGREIRQQLEVNFHMQQVCAKFINQILDRIRKAIWNTNIQNDEDVTIQLNGLEQIANVLEGSLTFDENSLQTLLNYKSKDKLIGKQNHDTI